MNCGSLTSVDALSGWDTSAVENMRAMFSYCESLESVDALSGWDTSAVTNMEGMFDGCALILTFPSWYTG